MNILNTIKNYLKACAMRHFNLCDAKQIAQANFSADRLGRMLTDAQKAYNALGKEAAQYIAPLEMAIGAANARIEELQDALEKARALPGLTDALTRLAVAESDLKYTQGVLEKLSGEYDQSLQRSTRLAADNAAVLKLNKQWAVKASILQLTIDKLATVVRETMTDKQIAEVIIKDITTRDALTKE